MKPRPRSLVITRLIMHPRERVFSALTDPAKMAQWFFGMKNGSAKVTNDLRPGGKYRIEMSESDGQPSCAPHGTYLEIVEPERLVFTWTSEGSVVDSKITIDLLARGTATELVLKHELPTSEIPGHRAGWKNCTEHLALFLDGKIPSARERATPKSSPPLVAQLKTRTGTQQHKVVSPKEWLAARTALLAEEKKLMREHDKLKQKRRELPWTKVEENYVFDGPDGQETLAELFEGKSQLIVYHFMFAPDETEGCAHCSFWADQFDGARVHLPHRDTNLVVISRAPLKSLARFQRRMGWKFKWLSSGKSEFNYDFHASFKPEDVRAGKVFYNYVTSDMPMEDREGISTFYKDKSGTVFHTYSTFARGIEVVNTTYHFLDLTAKGRDEDPEKAQAWVRYHDEYPKQK